MKWESWRVGGDSPGAGLVLEGIRVRPGPGSWWVPKTRSSRGPDKAKAGGWGGPRALRQDSRAGVPKGGPGTRGWVGDFGGDRKGVPRGTGDLMQLEISCERGNSGRGAQ